MRRLFLLFLLATAMVTQLVAQQPTALGDAVFKLNKEDGHFYSETTLNGVPASVLLESGVPGFMMSVAFYETNKDSLQLEVKESDEKIRYLGGIHQIKYTAQARLRIGDAIFDGPIKIVDGEHKLMVPIHMLRHSSDNSAIARLDLPQLELKVCRRDQLQTLVTGATALDITYNKWHMPVVHTLLSMNVNDRNASLEGDFIVDMGNGSLLFLNHSNASVTDMLKTKKIKLKEARDNRGKVVAKGIYADNLTICDRTYRAVSVGVAEMKSLPECGFLGLKFFTMPAIFDFDNNKMYLCK